MGCANEAAHSLALFLQMISLAVTWSLRERSDPAPRARPFALEARALRLAISGRRLVTYIIQSALRCTSLRTRENPKVFPAHEAPEIDATWEVATSVVL